jgi:hypothetical protein
VIYLMLLTSACKVLDGALLALGVCMMLLRAVRPPSTIPTIGSLLK